MSSDEDDEPGRIAFGHEGDYEDGQWIGSEFYARSQRKGRTQTKDEALYGYEGSSDEEGGRRGKKVRRTRFSYAFSYSW
jgi:tuftelin-interacting protein 11